MILECTECRTRYVVPDTAIGAAGRTVRCASCRHSWFQPGMPVLDLVARAEAASAAPPAPVPPVPAPPTSAPASTPPASTPPVEGEPPATLPEQAGPAYGDPEHSAPDYDAFAHQPPFRPRRNPARRWTIAALAAGLAMLGLAGAVLYSGAPGLAMRLFQTAEGSPLEIVSKPIDRHVFNGNDILAVSGTVRNPTDVRQPVPDIRADLRDEQRRIVYSWIIPLDTSVLPPRGQVQFDSAQVDVPMNAKELKLSFSGEPPR